MDTTTLLTGLIAIIGGIFISVYGLVLYRLVLASAGLMLGFWLAMRLTAGQDETFRLMVGLLVGGGLGLAFYTFYKLGYYIAGGLIGMMIAVVALSFIEASDIGELAFIIFLAFIGAVIARQLGSFVLIGATSLLGAYAIIYGIATLFPEQFVRLETGRINMNTLTLTLFVTMTIVSMLSQYQIHRLRGRREI
jgi:hypothetical protein